MASNIGDYVARFSLDVSAAIKNYTEIRQAHISTVAALGSGAGALTQVGLGLTAVGVGLAGGLLAATNAAAEFERKLDYFSAVSGATADQYDMIREKALQLGADTIYSADQIADSFVELAKSGVGVEDLMNGIGEAVANLGASTDMPLAEAATSLTTILNTFGLAAEDAVGVVDKLAGAANASSIDVQDLILTMTYAGASAKTAGISFEDINTAIALLGERGIKGSKAGTGLRQVIDKLIAPTDKGAKALEALGIQAEDGSSKLRQMDGTLKPFPELLDTLNGALDGMTQAQKLDILGQIFPITSLPTVLNLLDGGSAALARMNGEINKTTALEVAGERLDNLSGDVEYLRGELDTLIINIGATTQAFARGLVQSIEAVVTWLNSLDPAVLGLIVGLAGIVSVATILFGFLALVAAGLLNMLQLGQQLYPVMVVLAKAMGITASRATILAFALRLLPWAGLVALISLVAGALAFFFTQTESGQALMAQFAAVLQNIADNVLPQILPFIQQLAGMIGPLLGQALAAVMPLLQLLASILGGVISSAIAFITPLFETLAGVLSGGVAAGGGILAGILQVVAGILQSVLVPLLPIINQLLEGTAAAFAGVGQNASGIEGIGALVGSVLAGIINMIPVILTAIIQLATLIISTLVALLPTMITVMVQALTGILTAILSMLPAIVAGIIALVQGILQALVSAIPIILTAAIQMLTGVIQAIVTILPMVIQAVVQLIIAIVTALVAALPMIIQAGIQLLQGLIQAVVTILPLLIQGVLGGIVALIGALVMLIPQLLAAGIELFMGLVQAIPAILPPLITALISIIPTILGTLLGLVPLLLDAGLQLFMGLVNAVAEILPMLIEAIVGLLPMLISTVISLIPALLEAAIQLFTALVNAVPTILGALLQAVITLVTTLVPTIIGLIPVLLGAAVQLFMALVQAVPQIIGALLGAIGNLIGPIVDTVVRMVPQLLNGAVQLFNSIKDAIPRVFPAIIASLGTMGRQMIEGLVNGIRNMASRVIGVVQDVVGGAVNFAKGLLGIKSPSRVFRGIGINTIMGMIVGMQRTAPALERQMNMVGDSIDAFYDQVYAAREMDVMLNLASQMQGTVKVDTLESKFADLADQLTEIAERPTFNIEKMETNNPVPEPESESTPKSIRKLTSLMG